jgi:DNA-binding transcriptional LysR family regulator
MGIVMRPTFALREDLEAGRLVQVLPVYQLGCIAVPMVYLSRRYVPAKLASFVEFVARRFPKPGLDPWSTRAA